MTDIVAPTAPGTPAVSNATPTGLTLTWTASTDAVGVTAYRIYRDGALYSTVPNGSVGTWIATTLPSAGAWSSAAYGNGTFVAIAAGTTRVLTSPDGITWTERAGLPSIGANPWNSLSFGNGLFLAVLNATNSSLLATSPDGITWTQRALPYTSNACSAYGAGQFIALNSDSATRRNTANSADGITWTGRVNALPTSQLWRSVVFGGGRFVATAHSSTATAWSTDGNSWTFGGVLPTATNNYWGSLAYGKGLFVAVAYGTTSAATSPDGVTWTARTLASACTEVAYGNGYFVAHPGSISQNGTTWTAKTMPSGFSGLPVAFGNGTFAAPGYSSLTAAYLLADAGLSGPVTGLTPGTTYSFTVTAIDAAGNESAPSGAAIPDRVAPSTPGVPVISGNTGTQLQLTWSGSTDNVAVTAYRIYKDGVLYGTYTLTLGPWTATTVPTGGIRYWTAAAYGAGMYVALANGTTIAASSPDGITWTQRVAAASTAYWTSATYGNGRFVAVSGGSYSSTLAATSLDGITWTGRTLPADAQWSAVAYGNSTFVAVAWNSTTAATSPDGITWTARPGFPQIYNDALVYGNGLFVTLRRTTSAGATSPDGITWTVRTLPSSQDWISAAFGNGIFVAVAKDSNVCMASTDGITWTLGTMPSVRSWSRVVYGGGLFVAQQWNSTTAVTVSAYSVDGLTWTTWPLPAANASGYALTFGNGRFATVGYNSSAGAYAEAAALNATITGLTPGTSYALTATAIDAAGNESNPSAPAIFTPVPEVPAAPTVEQPSGTTRTTVLTWPAVSGTDSYNVYRNGVLVGTVASPTFTDTGIAGDGSYVYTLTASNTTGESLASPGTTAVVMRPSAYNMSLL